MKQELLRRYRKASRKQQQSGLDWYIKAHEECWRLAVKYRLPVKKVVGIMAALSPNNKWERNILDTEVLILHREKARVCTYGANKTKAIEILDLPSCLPSAITGILRGPKVTAFFWNIYRPTANGHITLDRWAIRAVGFEGSSLRKRDREAITQAYKDAAETLGIRNHELQAIVWEQIRNEKAI